VSRGQYTAIPRPAFNFVVEEAIVPFPSPSMSVPVPMGDPRPPLDELVHALPYVQLNRRRTPPPSFAYAAVAKLKKQKWVRGEGAPAPKK